MIKKKIISIIIVILITISVVFAISLNQNLYTGSDIKTYDTVYLQSNNNEEEITLEKLKELNGTFTVSIYLENVISNDMLYFYCTSNDIEFISEGEELVSYYDLDYYLYSVEVDNVSKLDIIFSDGVQIDKLFVCNNAQFSSYLFIKDLLYICLILIALFSSCLIVSSVLFYSILKRNVKLLFGYTILFVLLSLWCLTKVNYFQFVFSNVIAVSEMSKYIVFIIPIGILISSESVTYESRNKQIYQVSVLILCVASFFFLILHSIGIIDIAHITSLWFIFCILMLVGMTVISFESHRKENTPESKLLMYSAAILAVGMILEMSSNLISVTSSKGMFLTVSLLLVFGLSLNSIVVNYVKVENNRRFLSEENERLTSSILLSQIKPHFLYNALNSISYLCKKNPQKADIAVVKFSRYLRQNMKSIEDTDLIDFANEVEHIKNYLYLEAIRFPNIHFKFDIRYINFKIPPLCIQPIVENSVKHGASKNPDGGFVCLKSYVTRQNIVIEVLDNGVGFDDQKIIKGTGLSNISRRFAMHLNADVEFQSQIGKGSVVRVKIPRKGIE